MKRKKRRPAGKKRKTGRIRKFFMTILIVLIIVVISLIFIAWFYGGNILKNEFTAIIHSESRGLYKAEVRTLYIDLISGKVRVTGFRLIPDTLQFRKDHPRDTLPPFVFSASVEKFAVKGFDLLKAVMEKNVVISLIRIESPVVHVIACGATGRKNKEANRDPLSLTLPKSLNSIRIDRFQVVNGRMTITDLTKSPPAVIMIPMFWTEVTNIRIDSVKQTRDRILNSDDITLGIRGITMKTKNGMYTVTVGETGLSTGSSGFYVKDLHVKPNYSDSLFSRKLGYQADRVDLVMKQITLGRVNLREMLLHRRIIAGNASISDMKLYDYRDKRVPLRNGYSPPMPREMLSRIKPYLRIDTVKLKNGHVTYAEQVNDEPGKLFFDRMDLTMTNLTSDTSLFNKKKEMRVTGTARFMGKGVVNAHVIIPLRDKEKCFIFKGNLSEMDMCEFNPMLSKLVPARVMRGEIQNISVIEITAGNEISLGLLEFRYSGLKVEMLKKKQNSWENFKTKIVNFVANDLLIPDNNPDGKGRLTTGYINFRRDPQKGFFNYLWKSIQSGILSSIGFNNTEQKHQKKEAKKKN